ncbi:MAG: F0F1 ATP synthase subunit epsilon [Candidatus Latescibacter sp.]|nr:F0F1 ATP synthase subunit epsilon [Candidatus Latescibacter sp.]
MRLKILLPTEVFLETEAAKIVAEAVNGSFALLPRHIDFAAALAPGILSFTSLSGKEEFFALDEGVLVKQGGEVQISTRRAIRGPDLGALRRSVEEEFEVLDDREKKARSVLAKLEADFVRRFYDWGKNA